MIKQEIFTYNSGMNQDASRSKLANTFYYEGRNIRIITNESFGSVTNQKGNELVLTVPDIESNPTSKAELAGLAYPLSGFQILGHTEINKNLYLLTKGGNAVDTSKFFYYQKQSSAPDPYIDSNLRVIVDQNTVFESFVDSGGVVEGPGLSVGKNVRFQGFYLATEPNEPAPAPTLYLDIYKNGTLVSRQTAFCGDTTITLFYDVITEVNDVWFAAVYTLPQPAYIDNPFEEIDVDSLRLDGEPFAIWKVGQDYQIELKYFDILNVKTNKLDVESYYENENVIKIYWADGDAELRFINIADPNVMNLDKRFLSTVPKVNLSQPILLGFQTTGSSHTSGTIQYAYNLYNKNGAQTKISPLSEIIPLNNTDSGNAVGAKVSKAPIVQFSSLDTSFGFIRIYSIKHDIKNTVPKISLIYDRPIQQNLKITDDNNSVIQEIAFSEFVFLGGDIYIPKHIFTKDNHLFLANYKTPQYDIEFDARAYRYNQAGTTLISQSDGSEPITFNISSVSTINIPLDHDAVNPTNKAVEGTSAYNQYIWKSFSGTTIPSTSVNYYKYRICAIDTGPVYGNYCFTYIDEYDNPRAGCVTNNECTNVVAKQGSLLFQSIEVVVTQQELFITKTVPAQVISSGVLGGLGPNVGFEIKYKSQESNVGQPSMSTTPSLANIQTPSSLKGLKSGEVYRLYIEFLMDNGKFSFPKWVADVKIPDIGSPSSLPPVSEDGTLNFPYIEVNLINSPQDERVIGWRSCIVERTDADKTVVSQGIFNPAILDALRPNVDCFPSYFQRTVRTSPELPQVGNELNKPQRLNVADSGESVLSSNGASPTAQNEREITGRYGEFSISSAYGNLYTPEAVLAKSDLDFNGARLRKLGYIKNTFSFSSRKIYNPEGLLSDDLEGITGEGNNISRDTLEEGATLLTNLIIPPVISNSAGKFISDNKLVTTTKFFSKKTFAFVRYFGGYSKVRSTFDFRDNIDASGSLYQMSAIENIYSLRRPLTNTSVDFGTGANIPVFRGGDVNEIPTVTFKSYSGSNIAITDTQSLLDVSVDIGDLTDGDYGVMMEIYKTIPNQYGGDSYESRQLNRTIPYSKVLPISQKTSTEHYGDTYIQKFNSLRTFKSDNTEMYMTEIVSFPVETTINLDLRYDLMKYRPDNEEADELTSYGYNSVYDQQNNTIRGVPKPSNFRELNNFPTNILPSKVKIPNESIDSFTDFLINDAKTLDGKYGEITGIGEHSDNIYAFQRSAVAYLAINPRVQISTSDGIPTELGSGKLIERYQYLSSNSGTVNKWSIVKSKNGLLYFDLLNKSVNFIVDQELSTVKGLFNKVKKYSDLYSPLLEVDNIILNQGVHAHYDNVNEDTYFTFLTEEEKFTVSYNGLIQGFTSYYDFVPKYYIEYGNKLLSTLTGTNLYEHEKGLYQTYYGTYYPAHVTILANPEPFRNKIFNNIGYEGETYLNNVDVSNFSFNKLRVWNEYQNTGLVDLLGEVRPGLKRKFRNWNIIIPRTQGSRDRINSPWAFIELSLDKPTINYKVVLHDMIVSYI